MANNQPRALFSTQILTKKGPLAHIWLLAHQDNKLTKSQITATDLEKSIDTLLAEDLGPTSLRLSGQLLLGITRVYSRKTKYLFDDCNDSLVALKMQIRPALVDLPDSALRAPANDISLPSNNNLSTNPNDLPAAGLGGLNWNDFDLLATTDLSWDSFSVPRPRLSQGSEFGGGDDDLDGDETMSEVELGRRLSGAQRTARQSLGSQFGGGSQYGGDDFALDNGRPQDDAAGQEFEPELDLGLDLDLDMDLGLGDAAPMDLDFGVGGNDGAFDDHIDLGLDLGGDALAPPQEDGAVGNSMDVDEAASQVAGDEDNAAVSAAQKNPGKERKKKSVKIVVDEVTELSGIGAIGRKKDLSSIMALEQHFLPGTAQLQYLLAIRRDPLSHFLPTFQAPNSTNSFIYAGPPDLRGNPQLEAMFLFPASILRRRRAVEDGDDAGRKKARLEGGDEIDEEIELGRRQSLGPRSQRGSAPPMDFNNNDEFFAGGDDFQVQNNDFNFEPQVDDDLVLPGGVDDEEEILPPQGRNRESSVARSEYSTYNTQRSKVSTIAVGKTAMAQLLRDELKEEDLGQEGVEDPSLSFEGITKKSNRKQASSMFFELLLLGTKDCIRLKQEAGGFNDISISAKPKLWTIPSAPEPIALSQSQVEIAV